MVADSPKRETSPDSMATPLGSSKSKAGGATASAAPPAEAAAAAGGAKVEAAAKAGAADAAADQAKAAPEAAAAAAKEAKQAGDAKPAAEASSAKVAAGAGSAKAAPQAGAKEAAEAGGSKAAAGSGGAEAAAGGAAAKDAAKEAGSSRGSEEVAAAADAAAEAVATPDDSPPGQTEEGPPPDPADAAEQAEAWLRGHATEIPIWLIAVGYRGDVMCFIPISYALRDAGFKVVVWTQSCFTKFFGGQDGITVMAIDAPLFNRVEATKNFFSMKATTDAEGNPTETAEEVHARLTWLRAEVCHFSAMIFWAADKQLEMTTVLPGLEMGLSQIEFDKFDFREVWGLYTNALNHYYEVEAGRSQSNAVDVKAVRDRRRRELLDEIKRRANDLGVSQLDYIDTFMSYVRGRAVDYMQKGASKAIPKEEVLREMEEFFNWSRGRPVDQFLQAQIDRLPYRGNLNEADILGHRTTNGTPIFWRNLSLELDEAAQQDKPRLVITTQLCKCLGLHVAEKAGCRMVPLSHQPMCLDTMNLFNIFMVLTMREKNILGEGPIYRDRGPVVDMDDVREPDRHIALFPKSLLADHMFPREMKDDEELMRRFRENTIGALLLDVPRQVESEAYGGTPENMAALKAFLDKGDPPVCFYWSAMPFSNAKKFFDACCTALRQSGKRGVFLARFTKFREIVPDDKKFVEENVFMRPAAPHGWLFPRCCLVVNYGGRGTFYETIRSGVPLLQLGERNEGIRAAWMNAMRSHGHVKRHNQSIEATTAEALAKSIKSCLETPKMLEEAKRLQREAAAEWAGPEGLVRKVRDVLQANLAELQEQQAKLLCGPWIEGEYDIFNSNNKWVSKMTLTLGRGEVENEPIMWFRGGSFKRLPPKDITKPWLPAPKEEVDYNVEILCGPDGKVQYAKISEDGHVWTLDDNSRFVYRPSVPKNCQCVVS